MAVKFEPAISIIRNSSAFYLKSTVSSAVLFTTFKLSRTSPRLKRSIPAGVSGFFIDIKSFRSHYGPGVDSTSNRNEYQVHLLGVKAAGA